MNANRGPEPPDPPQPLDHRLFFSGTTLQQAVLAAARHFGLDPDVVAYRRREKTRGFVKGPRVVIEVDPAAPRHRAVAPPGIRTTAVSAPAASPAPRRPAPPRSAPTPHPPQRTEGRADRPPRRRGRSDRAGRSERAERTERPDRPDRGASAAGTPETAQRSPQEIAEGLSEAARRLFGLAGLDLTAELQREGTGWRVLLGGPDEGRVGADSELRSGLEHLLPRLLRGLIGSAAGARVVVGGRDAQREVELRELAKASAERVLASGEPVVLPEMNSFERRVVHVALAEMPGVLTESEGEGASRRVVVRRRG